MNILVITPTYPSTLADKKGATPVVHYFTKEWIQLGHTVTVLHLCTQYPSFFYTLSRPFQKFLSSKLGHLIISIPPRGGDEVMDGVNVVHRNYTKIIPHSRFGKSEFSHIIDDVNVLINEVKPSIVIGHWDLPQLEILFNIKKEHNIPTFLVLHGGYERLLKRYGKGYFDLINSLTGLGFRSLPALNNYIDMFGNVDNSFMAMSGVSNLFLNREKKTRNFLCPNNLIFVGALIKRKHPLEVVDAAIQTFDKDFTLSFVGTGVEKNSIVKKYPDIIDKQVKFTGRIERNAIVEKLDESDIFVMISKGEVFGLVYLEAMARGCITIASRNEGVDGIIVDGQNGFLCEAGNVNELAAIFNRIITMAPAERRKISQNAINTVVNYSDRKVAERYLDEVCSLINK